MSTKTFSLFVRDVHALLGGTARQKGYAAAGPDGPNPLYTFIESLSGGPYHALGEIVYKAQRFAARGHDEDLLKIAAWAYLIWKHHPPITKRHERRSS